jgi:hypothetical protein
MSVNPEGVLPSEERERLEEMGEARVRLVFNTNGFGSSNRIYAGKWLAELDEVQRARNEALQVEQTRVNKKHTQGCMDCGCCGDWCDRSHDSCLDLSTSLVALPRERPSL